MPPPMLAMPPPPYGPPCCCMPALPMPPYGALCWGIPPSGPPPPLPKDPYGSFPQEGSLPPQEGSLPPQDGSFPPKESLPSNPPFIPFPIPFGLTSTLLLPPGPRRIVYSRPSSSSQHALKARSSSALSGPSSAHMSLSTLIFVLGCISLSFLMDAPCVPIKRPVAWGGNLSRNSALAASGLPPLPPPLSPNPPPNPASK